MEDLKVSDEDQRRSVSRFYRNAEIYWSQVEPTIDGMMGGFGKLSHTDIQGSEVFLRRIFSLKDKPGCKRALDCGAGIGRVTKNLLSKHFEAIDLVEQNVKFIDAGRLSLSFNRNVETYYNSALQNFVPQKNYDIIWCQWVLGHLTDDDLVKFFIRCSNALAENGMIIIKENLSANGIIPDTLDSSITRTEDGFRDVFRRAGLEIVRHCIQPRFPKNLFIVKIFALRPSKAK